MLQSTINDLFEIVLCIGLFCLVIWLMARRDKRDKEQTIEVILEDPAPITDVIYYESMTLEDKYKKINSQLDTIGKLIPVDQELIDLQTNLADVVRLKQKVDDVYRFEMAQFENAIAWLETPSVTRGRYKPLNRGDDDNDGSDESFDMKHLMRAIRLAAKRAIDDHVPGGDKNFTDSTVSGYDDDNESSDGEPVLERVDRKAVDMFKMPDVGLNNLLEIRRAFERILPIIKHWTQKALDDVSETIKIWYVAFMIARRSTFNREKLTVARDVASEMVSRVVAFQAEINIKEDLTTMALELFPDKSRTVKKKGFLTQLLELLKRAVNVVRPK
ncbi:Hypothetical protein CINCED_3A023922 [Cinara cedri]|uniref:Uncharacterized protein n=1 Tax=Cinara cedri TaxID=506608 RepID=A0A5E4N5S2_9HEMI|nr:Hypothetical protein CINCED_3A023922 [Cinara cedri]